VGDGQVVIVIKDGKKVAGVDAGTWGVRDEEGATAATRRREGVHVKVTLTFVVWSRRLNDHDPTLDESNRNGTVAQHGGIYMR